MKQFECSHTSSSNKTYYVTVVADDEGHAKEMAASEAASRWRVREPVSKWNAALKKNNSSGPARVIGHRRA